jgi:NAD(P)-dependent dehydrogenase (short-subunit alcohol dehydrogenase family)
MMPTREVCESTGWERNLGGNHLGHFLLIQQLLPPLRAARGRVLSVSSCLHKGVGSMGPDVLAAALLEDPMGLKAYEMFKNYAQSKLAQVLVAAELQRREGPAGVTSISMHPGSVYTEVTRSMPQLVQLGYALAQPLCRAMQPTVAQAAGGVVHGVTCSTPERLAGAYLERCRAVQAAHVVENKELCRKVWEMSERMVK